MIPGAVHICPGIYLTTAEENAGKHQLGDSRTVRSVIASNGVPYVQMRSIGSHNTSKWEKEWKKERMGVRIADKLSWFRFYLIPSILYRSSLAQFWISCKFRNFNNLQIIILIWFNFFRFKFSFSYHFRRRGVVPECGNKLSIHTYSTER